jgi:NAD(P)-dependent dehydrogenase (short-subunit alcohol dehydrogenase family)
VYCNLNTALIRAEVTNVKDIDNLVSRVEEEFGGSYIILNNAKDRAEKILEAPHER